VLKAQICVTRPQCVKMDSQEVGCGGVDWIEVTQDTDRWRALVTAVMKPRVR